MHGGQATITGNRVTGFLRGVNIAASDQNLPSWTSYLKTLGGTLPVCPDTQHVFLDLTRPTRSP